MLTKMDNTKLQNIENSLEKYFTRNISSRKQTFKQKMKLIDYKGRELSIGQRVRVEEDVPSPEGMLYKDSIVKIDEWHEQTKKIRVTDSTGKVWWVEPTQVSCSFL